MPIEVIMPHLGAVAEESTLLKWLIREGDHVEKGQPIFEAESDKATVEVEAPESGKITRLIASPGEVVQAGGVIAILHMLGEADETLRPEIEKVEAIEKVPPVVRHVAETKAEGRSDRLVASPLARRLARSKGIDIRSIKGTGPGDRIIKADVEDTPIGRAPIPAFHTPSPMEAALSLSAMRTTIAQRMAQSAHRPLR